MTIADRVAERLRHMYEAAAAIQRLTAGKSFEDFRANQDMAAAVERYLERLSEASRHLPDSLKTAQASIDWRGVGDIGNVLRHAYDRVSDRRIWDTVTVDLAPLLAAIEAMLATLNDRDGLA